ncbi:MAG: MCE family protein [Desulfamplus sp.]|nr:MCE family protein [Desulfamplus sp.]
MSKKPDNVLIGGFVAGAVALVVVVIMVLGSGSLLEDKNLFVLHFKGSVKGLAVGAPVVLRGVKVGSVKEIRISATSNSRDFSIPVLIEIGKDFMIMPNNSKSESLSSSQKEDSSHIASDITADNLSLEQHLKGLIDQGLRAQLEMQSIVTGQLLVGLDFHPEKPARLSGEPSQYPEIPTIQTELEEIAQKIKQVPIEEMFNKLFSIISSVDKSFNPESIGQLLTSLSLTLQSLNKISDSLDEHLPAIAADIQATIKNSKLLVQNANNQVTTIAESLNSSIEDTQNLVSIARFHIETTGESINQTLSNTNRLITDINSEVSPIAKSVKETMRESKETLGTAKDALNAAKAASEQAEVMFKGVDRAVGSDSALINNLNNTLNDLSDAARSLRLLAEYLERHPEALIQGKR